MQALNISKQKFLQLERFNLPKEVFSTECQLYIIEAKEKWNKKRLLLKKLFSNSGSYFGNKLLTLNTLIDNKDFIGIDELVFPESIVVVDKRVVGFSMPFIEDTINIITILQNYNVSTLEKIGILKQIGEILKKVQRVKKFSNNFFLGDVYEGNFIMNVNTGIVYAVDLDSCKIGNNQPFHARYLASNPNISAFPHKYPTNAEGIYIPNHNTELMCYVFIILNTIAKGPIHRLSSEQYFTYLQYLSDIGFSNELLDCFVKVYTNGHNVSPQQLLDSIPDNVGRANYKVYQHVLKTRNQ